jgi:hypothetical protein
MIKMLHTNTKLKLKIKYLIIFSILTFTFINQSQSIINSNKSQVKSEKTVLSCTNFAASIGDTVLFGNTEDASKGHPLFKNPEGSYLWFFPSSNEGYGCVQFGWFWEETHVSFQGGMNEFGLCYDSTGIPDIPLNSHPEKPFRSGTHYIWSDILRKCENVSDAVSLINNYEFKTMWYQIFLTDANGEIAIISPNFEGELTITKKGLNDGYLAQTNFNKVEPTSYYNKYPCPRYEKTSKMLEEIISQNKLCVGSFKNILEAIQQSGAFSYTPYSNIFDPKNGLIYIYCLSQFDEVIELNLTQELSLGEHKYQMSTLFSQETIEEGLSFYNSFKIKNVTINISIISISIIFVILSPILAVKYIKSRKNRKNIKD